MCSQMRQPATAMRSDLEVLRYEMSAGHRFRVQGEVESRESCQESAELSARHAGSSARSRGRPRDRPEVFRRL